MCCKKDEACCICLEPLICGGGENGENGDNNIYMGKCCHTFHSICIYKWKLQCKGLYNTCPICKIKLGIW